MLCNCLAGKVVVLKTNSIANFAIQLTVIWAKLDAIVMGHLLNLPVFFTCLTLIKHKLA